MSLNPDKILDEAAAPSCAGVFLAASGAVNPLDDVLAGMVAAGLGQPAIESYLGLARIELLERLAAHGLPTPHERPARRSGRPNAWTDGHFHRLIEWWIAGVRVSAIAEALGRSRGAIYAKRRRLGLPRRDRRRLLHCSAAELLGGATLLASQDLAVNEQVSSGNPSPDGPTQDRSPLRTESKCRAGGLQPAPAFLVGAPAEEDDDDLDLIIDFQSQRKGSWRIPELRPTPQIIKKAVVDGGRKRRAQPHVGEPTRWTPERNQLLIDRGFALQSVAGIALDLGLRESQVSNQLRRLGLGEARRVLAREHGMAYAHTFDAVASAENRKRAEFYMRSCVLTQKMFWTRRGSGQTKCPEARKSARYAKRRQEMNWADAA